MKHTAPGRAGGFTLIEVLVALVIVAFGMGAVLSSLTSAANNTMQLRERSFAEWVGLNQLAAARLDRAMPVDKKEGDVEFAGSYWHWLQQASDMEIPGVKRILIQVRHGEAPGAGNGPKAAQDWLATVTGFRGDGLTQWDGMLGFWDSLSSPTTNPNANPGRTPTSGPDPTAAPTPAPPAAPPTSAPIR
jgi:general secretion pathway protein I